MRRLLLLSSLVLVIAASIASTALGGTPGGSGTPACLRGNWVASQAETNRVLESLVPTGGFEARGRLYMIFEDGAFQYGSRQLVLTGTFGEITMTARGSFFSLAAYSARRGAFTTRAGEITVTYGKMSGSKGGKTYTVDGPPSKTRAIPGGTTPYRCDGSTLQVKLPRISSLGWITLRRGTP